jgi:hypothetical protein
MLKESTMLAESRQNRLQVCFVVFMLKQQVCDKFSYVLFAKSQLKISKTNFVLEGHFYSEKASWE